METERLTAEQRQSLVYRQMVKCIAGDLSQVVKLESFAENTRERAEVAKMVTFATAILGAAWALKSGPIVMPAFPTMPFGGRPVATDPADEGEA